ncbi:hypothetical protein GCM10010284_08280 [Streptomyces rubiginosohelvolus]|uniref:Secreted protein n=1 Tax=Streptomyces rubiginosohelvolus TaxID=67362 RepID=A0ABQ3C0D1_9ACTN|nr:hypothetical protein GCM10010284_08280 [Streptomyces rubiginosohelvolus]GGZ63473.1 hypothetical protein GCM10010328_42520 [Streptomyces pluricolorescens]
MLALGRPALSPWSPWARGAQSVLTLGPAGAQSVPTRGPARVQPAPTRFSNNVTPYVRPPSPFFPACSPTTTYPASS